MLIIKCDSCEKDITLLQNQEKVTEIFVSKGRNAVRYHCCSDKCAQKLFGNLHKNWLGNNESCD